MNKIFKNLVLLLLALSFTMSGFAQKMQFKGQVWDKSRNETILGANVMIQGTTTGVSTDLDGNFVINAKVGDILIFSYIGYDELLLKLTKGINLSRVELTENSNQLEEVIVVGYGQQKKASSVGSIATAKGDDLLQVGSVRSVSEALQGQMPGVMAISTTSKPGEDAANLFIRGKATWGDASPMVLIDGVERDFNDVDVNEVESISVLKDASATAVYGVKGANGVILLTTKRGTAGKTTVKFNANFGIKQPTTELEFAPYTESMSYFNEAAANDGSWDKLIPHSTIDAWENAYATGNYGPYNDQFPEIDWQDAIMKDFGTQQTYNVNVSGGTERMTYFASLGYLNDGDIYKTEACDEFDPSFNYQRYNWRSNFDFKVTNTTKLSINVAGKMGYQNQPGYRSGDSSQGSDGYLFNNFLRAPTNLFPIQYSDGMWGADETGGNNLVADLSQLGQRQTQSFQGFYDVILKQNLDFVTKGLSVTGKLAYTSSSSDSFKTIKAAMYGQDESEANKFAYLRTCRSYDYANPIVAEDGSVSYPLLSDICNPGYEYEPNRPTGSAYDQFGSYGHKLYYELALNYARTFEKHEVGALALFNRKTTKTVGNNVEFPTYEEDWVGRVTYGYDGRYLAEVNASYTGSEKFAPGKRFGFFPSFSLGWRLTEEDFMESVKGNWLTNMKIRYSWGQVGSDKGAKRFNYIQIYNTGNKVIFGDTSDVTYNPLYTEGTLAYPNATWETAVKQNLGIDITLVDRLNIMVDLYDEQREGILMARQTTAPWVGVNLPSMNLGQTKNHGIDVNLEWNDKIGSDFRYYAKYTFGTSESRILFKDDPGALPEYMKDAGKPIGYAKKYLVSGNYSSIDDIYNGVHTSINKTAQNKLVPGDLAYLDYNADGVLDAKDSAPVEQLNYPLTTMGLTLGFSYKGFSMNALFYAALGVYKDQLVNYQYDFPTSLVKAQPDVASTWSYDDAYASEIIRPSVHLANDYNKVSSTYTYSDHSFLRLKNLEFSYTLPKSFTSKAQISNCQIYLNGSNLFTISNVDKRRDPETGAANVYPIVKRYNVGLRLTFN